MCVHPSVSHCIHSSYPIRPSLICLYIKSVTSISSVCLSIILSMYPSSCISTVGYPFIRPVYMRHPWMSPILSMTPWQPLSRHSDSPPAIGWQFSAHHPHGRSPRSSALCSLLTSYTLVSQTRLGIHNLKSYFKPMVSPSFSS